MPRSARHSPGRCADADDGNPAFGQATKSAPAADSASTGGLTGVPGSVFSSDEGFGFALGFSFFLVTCSSFSIKSETPQRPFFRSTAFIAASRILKTPEIRRCPSF